MFSFHKAFLLGSLLLGCQEIEPSKLTADMVDVDGDGYAPVEEGGIDCDDQNASSYTTEYDADCDGVRNLEDCDDNDASQGSMINDADCDGVQTIEDCDDNDSNSTIVEDDEDCDGYPVDIDCNDYDSSFAYLEDESSIEQMIPLDMWICGSIYNDEAEVDVDGFQLKITEDGWLQIEADTFQSFQGLNITLEEVNSGATVSQTAFHQWREMMIPVIAGQEFDVQISDSWGRVNDAHIWQAKFSMIKESDISFDEKEDIADNDLSSQAVELDLKTPILASLDVDDVDWYVVSLPDGEHTIDIKLDGFRQGSPLQTRFSLYSKAQLDNGDIQPVAIGNGDSGQSITVDEGGEWLIKIENQNEDISGSVFHWYVLDIAAE